MGEVGSLGPDLQDEELLNKRAQKERLKDYSAQLRKYNKDTIQDDLFARPAVTKVEPPKPKSKREMAKEYAAKVPRPKVKTVEPQETEEWDDEVEFAEMKPMSELERLEIKHREDQAAVANIRKQLGMGR